MARVEIAKTALADLERLFDELVLSRGRDGYIAKYRYAAEVDRVFILAVRHQREAGYLEET